ncbi:hypothetical protein [Gracilibacillus saliphilus]|uniref:hypothetical protein n=1 Tax=Gracilibacillus saliphilus TaxID=543890 RepID=UPI0013D1D22F|nr:hypothetical protein [Gracilibacillus saliphilus]
MNTTTKSIKPRLLKKININQAGENCKMYLGDLTGDGRLDLLMVQPNGGIDDRYEPHQVEAMTAFNLEGDLLWQLGTPSHNPGGPGSDYPVQIYDIDGDDYNEVLCIMDHTFLQIDGKTGTIKKKYPLPAEQAHDCIIIANLTGNNFPQDIILKDRYHQMWALNNQWELLWTHEGNIGHFPWAFDFNSDGKDEVMAGYDFINSDGQLLWSCRDLEEHADCIWVGKVQAEESEDQIVIGGSVTVLYDWQGNERWRYSGSIESQHVCLGNFRRELPGLQIAGLDRIKRGSSYSDGKDGIFLLDSNGKEIWKENRETAGWLTIIDTIHNWDDNDLDYILAYRRGDNVYPTIYDGYKNVVTTFPKDGYLVYGDLVGSGKSQVIIYDQTTAYVYASEYVDLSIKKWRTQQQSKRLYSVTLYPGGEYLD